MLQTLLNNKHTSIAATVYIGASVLSKLAAIWLPEYKVQCDQTLDVLKEIAVSYGLVMAGDAKPTEPKTP